MENTTRFVWFWTFWHWGKEGSRAGLLARDPLIGIGANWEEWFRAEATDEDQLAIAEVGRTRAGQGRFIAWLVRHWSKESEFFGNRLVSRFVLGQLATTRPFAEWEALAKYRSAYGATGISAVILAEDSAGTASDVRSIEALIIPSHALPAGEETMPEGFKAEAGNLLTPRQTAAGVLGGRARWALLALWLAIGQRPYRTKFSRGLSLGWVAAAGIILWLLRGPDPGEQLPVYCGLLLGIWTALVLSALTTATIEGRRLSREGREWAARLEKCQVRLRMNDGLTVKGGSAGLAFTLNTLLATYRALPGVTVRSWIWRRTFRALDSESRNWAATGVVTAEGWIKSVVLPPKLRACFHQPVVQHLLAPQQREASVRSIRDLMKAVRSFPSVKTSVLGAVHLPRLGFAAEAPGLRVHRCSHVAQALLAIGQLVSYRQMLLNIFALGVSGMIFVALPSMWGSLFPAPPPAAVPPSSSSPYYLWVSLDTVHPEQFQVVLESRYWINRRVSVLDYGEPGNSRRAEIRLLRLAHVLTLNPEDGSVWVERRRTFLSREYAPGERVGLYSVSYLNHLGREK